MGGESIGSEQSSTSDNAYDNVAYQTIDETNKGSELEEKSTCRADSSRNTKAGKYSTSLGLEGRKISFVSQMNYPFEGESWWKRRAWRKQRKEYHENLQEMINCYGEDGDIMSGRLQPTESENLIDRRLANISTGLNVILLFSNLTASILSGSLAIVSTFVDSFMDITSSVIIAVCLWYINHTNHYDYPRGRARLELIGVLLCSIIMAFANVAVVLESFTRIVNGNIKPEVDYFTLGLMLGGAAVKSVLAVICYRRGTASSKMLALDMRNDTVTSLGGLICAVLGAYVWKYADPVGAIVVCTCIATSWFMHALEQVPTLTGRRAEREQLSRILKIAMEHDSRIKYIDHVMVYHVGPEALVEMHIVMDENLTLKETHDIAHPLEKKLQKLDFVERCFVHCDYFCDGD